MDIAALVNAASLCDGRRIGDSSASATAATVSQLETSSAPISACHSLASNASLSSSEAVAVAASHASTSITAVPPTPAVAAAPGPEPASALDHLGSSPMGLKRRSTVSAGSGNDSPFPKVLRASHELPSQVALQLQSQGAAAFFPACLLQSPTSATGGSELSASILPAVESQQPELHVHGTCPGNPVIGSAAGSGMAYASATSTSHIDPNATHNALHGDTSTSPTAACHSFGGISPHPHPNASGVGAGTPVKCDVSLERPANHHSGLGSGSGVGGAGAGAKSEHDGRAAEASAHGSLLSHTSPPHAVAFEAAAAAAHQWAHMSQPPPSMHSSSTVAPSLAHGFSAANAISPPAVVAVGTPVPPLGVGAGGGAHHQHGHQQTQQTGLLVPAGFQPPTGSFWLPIYAREPSKRAESTLLREKLHLTATHRQHYVLQIAQARGPPVIAGPFGGGGGGGDESNGGSTGGVHRHRSRSQRSISLGPVHQPRIGLHTDELDEVLYPLVYEYSTSTCKPAHVPTPRPMDSQRL